MGEPSACMSDLRGPVTCLHARSHVDVQLEKRAVPIVRERHGA